jgi:integrase
VIDIMPRPRPPLLHRQITQHGKLVWYVRRDKGPRTRIRAEFGTPKFDHEYQAAIAGERLTPQKDALAGSLKWLIERYRETPAWTSLSLATRRQRENILRQVIQSAGSQPYNHITAAEIAAGRDRRGKTPFQARHFLDTMRGLFEWAKDAQLVKSNSAADVKYPRLKSGEGFPVWTEDDAARYEAHWPLGTRQRVWFAVLRYTGLRRGDAVRLGRQHLRDEVINGRPAKVARMKTEKTATPVTIQVLPPLLEALEAGPTADLAFICGSDGKPMTKESFGNAFKDACRAAGVKKSAHGIRKLAATTSANNGATLLALNAQFGWTGSKMAGHYTQGAHRERLALENSGKLLNESRTSIPSPRGR